MMPPAGPPLSRAQRRRLERRSDRTLARMLDALRGTTCPLDPREAAVIALDGEATVTAPWPVVRAMLIGTLAGGAELADAIEAERARRDALSVPGIVIVDGYASVAWTRLVPMSAGGVA